MCTECDIEKILKKVSPPEGATLLLKEISKNPALLFCGRDLKTRLTQKELFTSYPKEIEEIILGIPRARRIQVGSSHFVTTIDWMRGIYCFSAGKHIPSYMEWVDDLKRCWLGHRVKKVYLKENNWIVEQKITIKDELEGLDFINLLHHVDEKYVY
jgi:hypothetical protein